MTSWPAIARCGSACTTTRAHAASRASPTDSDAVGNNVGLTEAILQDCEPAGGDNPGRLLEVTDWHSGTRQSRGTPTVAMLAERCPER